jgi:hypothetical protein
MNEEKSGAAGQHMGRAALLFRALVNLPRLKEFGVGPCLLYT